MPEFISHLAILARKLTQADYDTHSGLWNGVAFSVGDFLLLNGLNADTTVAAATFTANYSPVGAVLPFPGGEDTLVTYENNYDPDTRVHQYIYVGVVESTATSGFSHEVTMDSLSTTTDFHTTHGFDDAFTENV